MGARNFRPFSSNKLLCLCGALVFVLVLINQANAHQDNKQLDSDLIFETIEENSLKHGRHRRYDAGEAAVSEDSSHNGEDNWMSRAVHRIKRGFFDFLLPTTTAAPEEDEEEEVTEDDQELDQTEDQGQNLIEPNSKEIISRETVDNDYGGLEIGSHKRKNDTAYAHGPSVHNTDDEDFYGSGHHGEHSGAGATDETTHHVIHGENHPVYYRIRFIVNEPYNENFADAKSKEYRKLAEEIEDSVEPLYMNVPGTQRATVIKIEKKHDDNFQSVITLDLESVSNVDKERIRNTIYNQISNYHMIGEVATMKEDFMFREFQVGKTCSLEETPCKNGDCIPIAARCDGYNDCSDNSDEDGCDVAQICKPHEFACTRSGCIPLDAHCDGVNDCSDGSDEVGCPKEIDIVIEGDLNSFGEDGDEETTTTPTTTTEVHTLKPTTTPTRCRADDVLRCADGQTVICADQSCDGNDDCPDGDDEENCPTECAKGEIGCDITRCIPESLGCDGKQDCDDGTDERECPETQCHSGQFRCDDARCIDNHQRCDGRHDCSNGEDEFNCSHRQDRKRCEIEEFTCGDGSCVHKSKRCDGHRDCRDSSDEKTCPCKPSQFECTNKFCIPASQRCDNTTNCQDGSDEENCPNVPPIPPCEAHQRRCKDGTCIDQIKFCNGRPDCPDKSDEMNCCMNDQFRCSNGTCLQMNKHCDGVPDCQHAEDEDNCGGCKDGEFECDAGFCIMGYKRCNGYKDCPSGSDEENCFVYTATTCGPNQFRCNDGQCIGINLACDHYPDCLDKSDETDCSHVACNPGEFRCNDGTCMNATKCDGVFECTDYSDEMNCQGVCSPDQFRCDSGECIQEYERCNSVPDCADGSDEHHCVHHCPPDQFLCGNGVCLDGRRLCDGFPDCPDKSDEFNCGTSTCDEHQFQCVSTKECISSQMRCDSYSDCEDSSDEAGCPNVCQEDEFHCGDPGDCIPLDRRCDDFNDCENGADEENCGDATQKPCGSGDFTCHDGGCIPRNRQCDGRPDCADHSDELRCGGCPPNEFECGDGLCIPDYLRCNERMECSDGSDEENCPTRPPPPTHEPYPPARCSPGYQSCRSGNQCYPSSAHCDGRVDCHDLSDEDNCPPQTQACNRGMFRCENGPCIPEHLRCNGRLDCPLDSSDELDCPTLFPSSEGLNLRTYPNEQEIKESREVVFQCRDEGQARAKVRWSRGNGLPLPPGTKDVNGRLEMPNIQLNHSGTYICSAVGFPPGTAGAQISVRLDVNPYVAPTSRPPEACGLYQATCSNGDCIDKNLVCNGKYDCSDGSDETRCNLHGCEPNEFRCANKRCILKTWRCDADDDCGDNSDEQNCATNPPGSQCEFHQFACRSGNQCIPKSFHCDQSNDCADGSDEIGCSPVTIMRPPPPMMQLQIGETFEVSCTAVGVPTPEIVWRLNWGHVPEKCKMTSANGVGNLTCPDIQESDQGAYSCEGINIKGSVIATPDTILMVGPRDSVCPKGFFNEEAVSPHECISCFCFGVTKECSSADLFTYHLLPPFDSLKNVGVNIDPYTGVVDVRDEPSHKGQEPRLSQTSSGGNGVHAYMDPQRGDSQPSNVPYFSMPEYYNGNQLKSYGGYLKYNLRFEGYGNPTTNAPDLILKGNGFTLLHMGKQHQAGRPEDISVRFFVGEWVKKSDSGPETLATREEIMMVLASVENILIKLQYIDGVLDTTIDNIEMDSAASRNTGLGQATFVEQCRCPVGYTGLSCELCAVGYQRHRSGPWLGQCHKEIETCPPGTYGDPANGMNCQVCPCPLTNPGNQFARTCRLDADGYVTCDCPPEYVGRRCDRCAAGYEGQPLIPGDYCKPASQCSPEGAVSSVQGPGGQCHCKPNTDGPTCNTCKKNSFHLSADNQFGCISCFCMGITEQCSSSNWYRTQITSVFTRSKNEFKLVESNNKNTQIEDGIILDPNEREIIYKNFRRPTVYYWSLPSRFLGDKVSSYGGFLRYSLRYVPTPGGQSSKNNAPDVEIISDNHITLTYFARDQPPPNNIQSFSVPLLEQHWQRSDGQQVDREHLMMALADVKAILIKATYTTSTGEAALQSVSLDISEERNTGGERALAVEQCYCPQGYKGLSCEDCDAGYTRVGDEGIYLGLCEKCQCNGHSNECDPETGTCYNCRDHTTGEHCERCASGFEGDPANRIPCRYVGGHSQVCDCNPDGSISNDCVGGVCQCKTNVQGNSCDRCREGTFGLNSSIPEGCQSCFCSGVATECYESNHYIQQIPSQIFGEDHGFILTDAYMQDKITNNFQLNIAMNEIGYTFRPSNTERLFWSLPSTFTGQKIKSFGGKLEFTQRYTQRPDARYNLDRDVIINGNGISIFWTNPVELRPNIANKVSVTLSPSAKWQRIDHRSGPHPASREDILKVLANINSILIRAKPSSDTASSFISDLTLDTAVEQRTGQPKATSVEVCVCPTGYSGTSCELCSAGYYRDINDVSAGPLGSCSKCPCSGNEVSCQLGPSNRVLCNCLPGYNGPACEYENQETTTPPPTHGEHGDPSITITINSPKLTIKEVGGEVRFNCTASSAAHTQVRIRWNKDDGSLPERAIDDGRGFLVITNLRVSDSGNYICEASDGISIMTDHVNLAVGSHQPQKPYTQIYQSYIEVTEGEPIELYCTATGVPAPSIEWRRANREPLSERRHLVGGTLTIQNAQKSDEGEYHCIARNSAGEYSSVATVVVKDLGGTLIRPIITPSSYTGTSGESFTLTCEAGRSRYITWSKQGGYLPYRSRDEHGILIVTDAQVEDSGIYVCNVNEPGTTGTATVKVNIVPGDSGVYPSVKAEPTSLRVSQGSDVEIRCEASGSPIPTLKWTRLGDPLPSHVHQTGPVLKLHNVQMSDRGVYVCVATNNLGLAQASSVVEVERREAPIVEIYPKHTQTINAGGSLILSCSIKAGIPNPTIRWHRPNGQPINQQRVEILDNGVLRFSRITEEDGGEYICTAENEVGKVTAVGNVIVQTPPTVTINPPGDQLVVNYGEFVRLECHATGSPAPSVHWSKYNAKPDIAAVSRSHHVAVFEITSASQEDEGIYTCLANNDAGTYEGRIRLIVDNSIPQRGDITGNRTGGRGEDPGSGGSYPHIPGSYKHNERQPSVVDEQTFTVPVGTRADLRCNIANSGNDQIYTNWIRADNSSLPQYSEIREGTLIISNAQPSDAGEYRCLGISTNTGNILFIVTAHVKVLSIPRITLNPAKQVVRPGDNAVIDCTATGEQPITISWSGMNRAMPSSVYLRGGYLQFQRIQLSDAGRYKCRAVNSYGEADAVAEVIVQEDVQPPIVASNREVTAEEGSSVTLTCNLRSDYGVHDIRWMRENDDLPPNARSYGEQLKIYNIGAGDSGKYYCEIPTADGGSASDYINLIISNRPRHSSPTLDIQTLSGSSHVGDHLDVYCRSSEPGVITTWTKLSGRVADNVQINGGNLRFNSVRLENGGVYRCEARGYEGFYHKDHMIDVIDAVKEEKDIAIKSAPEGSTIILDCKTDLDEPVNYVWAKQRGPLPRDVDIHARSIQLNDVGGNDAGTYVCTSSNAYKTIETPTILLITGIVPYFTQAPSSFIGLPPLSDSYLQFNVEISFKPENHDGLILYNGNKKNAPNGDFISLALVNGIPEFRFNLGRNSSVTLIQGDRPLTIGQWHTIKIARNKRKGTMFVDDEGPFTATAATKYVGLTLHEPLFLGGVPNFDEISPLVNINRGMVGCISRLKIGHGFTDVIKEAQLKKGVTSCETCSHNPCENRGVCQESLGKEGFMCICPSGYRGPTCNKYGGEFCNSHTCGTGRCVDTDEGYNCLCPIGRAGRNCEHEIEIIEPAFSNNAFMAYPTPTQLRRLKMTMKIKPKDLNDSIIAYCGEDDEGYGDFVSLSIKDKHLQFKFDVGNGPVTIESQHELVVDRWVVITASKISSEGKLMVNGDRPETGRSEGVHRALNLNTKLYIGGYDSERIKISDGVGVSKGFHGCISEVSISSLDVHPIHGAEHAANVLDCKNLDEEDFHDNDVYNTHDYAHENPTYLTRQTGCSSNPCRNDGQCYPLSPVEYKCNCINGYTGTDCEIAPNLCDHHQPCKNDGICHGNTSQYTCDCKMGYTGINCETPVIIRNDAHFSGNGYLEFSRNNLNHENDEEDEVIALELSTNATDGLIFWHGQGPQDNGSGQDYIALAVVNGYLEFSYNLGSGSAMLKNDKIAVNDGMRHRVILKRRGKTGSIEVDNDFFVEGEAPGLTNQMNCNGNIYLGGTPNINLMTGGLFTHGFNGCVHGFELQDSKTLDLGQKALSGLNVKACYRSNDVFDDDDDEEPPAN